MSNLVSRIEKIFTDFVNELDTQKTQADVLNLKAKYLGKKGELANVLSQLKDLSPEERQTVGPKSNEAKDKIQSLVQEKLDSIEKNEINEKLAKDRIDVTLRNSIMEKGLIGGGHHPIHMIQREIEDIFLSMGYDVLDGPHIEDEFHNFEALNVPSDHPARDMQDTFWFEDPSLEKANKSLLRTHTSAVQIRGMMERKPPFRFIAPGKVFRCERTDASHEAVFHQLEGMYVGKDISVSNLIYFMKIILKEIFKKEVEVRLRPGFFPFVEPGFELDIKCLICGGKGCSVCKHVGWVELLPCGLIHPNVLRHGGIDPNEYNGFAFGLGLDRLVMMRYGIEDIRHFHGGDLRFISQFRLF